MTLWTRAQQAAAQTPLHRNRTADFFRAVAILVVVFGHWLVNVPHLVDGELRFTELLATRPATQYVTWVVQVMPVFFFVGGYSNAASWEAARRNPDRRRVWAATRMRRLLLPMTPLVVLWAAIAGIAAAAGAPDNVASAASRAALIPVWFLAVYLLVTVAVPLSHAAWRRIGLRSVAALVAAAVLVDLAGLAGGQEWLRWTNYAFVWLAMHQMGYWWRRGIPRAAAAALLAGGVAWLLLLVGALGYPVAMISVPGEAFSNSRPPTVAMLAIGCAQAGLIVLLSGRVARWLESPRPWAAVILVSQRIMTVYLWHMTALLALVGAALLAGGLGLGPDPGSGVWWATRLPWMAALVAALVPLVLIFGRLEDGSRQAPADMPGPLRTVAGALAACAGLTFLALEGTHADTALGVNLGPVLLVLAGIALATVGRRHRR